MTITDVIEMARKAGGNDEFTSPPTDWIKGYFVISPEELLKFAALVRNAVLEECAAKFEGQYTDSCPGTNISAAIRAMKEQA